MTTKSDSMHQKLGTMYVNLLVNEDMRYWKNEFADDSSKSLEHQKLGPSPTSRINQTIPSHEQTDERLSYQK
ncbi:hypothetical protein QJS10_CPA10g00379 [Acorus calamus]|uniref:Uncharacterized protein n=1 Tax=Acorus calamus TaxID=4465 RepID=A0AAV9DWT7_ACOCL|nr:hypothetical protein QJS10_CPA10g00379 [Acorus calamus]